jgi:hypothetical protein
MTLLNGSSGVAVVGLDLFAQGADDGLGDAVKLERDRGQVDGGIGAHGVRTSRRCPGPSISRQ